VLDVESSRLWRALQFQGLEVKSTVSFAFYRVMEYIWHDKPDR